ncbi:MAG: hypothetical protein WC760_04085 [Bacteroidia bacterium]
MLKFLIYLFLIYFLVRFVFGRLFGITVKKQVYQFHTHHHTHKQETHDEGKVKVHPVQQKKEGNDKNLGDYVEYEEVE